MKELSNTLKPYIERWDDPGDYPNNVASGPLPSYDFVSEVEGEVTIEIEDVDFFTLIDETFDPELPHGIKVRKWEIIKAEGRKLTFAVKEFEANRVERDYPDYGE